MAVSPALIAGMVGSIAATFETMLPQIGTIAGISDDTLTKITTAIDDLRQAATAFATTDAPGDMISRIEADSEAVLSVLAGLPLTGPLKTGFQVAQMLLPMLIAVAKMVVGAKSA